MYTQGPRGSAGLPTDDKSERTPPLKGNTAGPGNQNGTTRSVLSNNQESNPAPGLPTQR
jgi:hypothetical protein